MKGWHKHSHSRNPMSLNAQQIDLCETSPFDFSGLSAVFLNCTLKRSPEKSHTRGLIDISKVIMEKNGVNCEVIRPVDFDIAYGVQPDMKEHGWANDEWPGLLEKVLAADILVIGTSIWLGEKTSVATKVIERLYSASSVLNEAGQYAYYGRTGGALITGNEDGAKHCAMNLLYSMQHLGYSIPPAGRCRMARRSRARSFVSRRRIWRPRE
jgi:multimeric flavodoxin WrbA